MTEKIGKNDWVWAVVQNPGGNEEFLGQQEEGGVSFIPLFREKEQALMCMNLMARDKQKKYEVQAVIYSDICDQASAGGFKLYVLDGEGKILDKIKPDAI